MKGQRFPAVPETKNGKDLLHLTINSINHNGILYPDGSVVLLLTAASLGRSSPALPVSYLIPQQSQEASIIIAPPGYRCSYFGPERSRALIKVTQRRRQELEADQASSREGVSSQSSEQPRPWGELRIARRLGNSCRAWEAGLDDL